MIEAFLASCYTRHRPAGISIFTKYQSNTQNYTIKMPYKVVSARETCARARSQAENATVHHYLIAKKMRVWAQFRCRFLSRRCRGALNKQLNGMEISFELFIRNCWISYCTNSWRWRWFELKSTLSARVFGYIVNFKLFSLCLNTFQLTFCARLGVINRIFPSHTCCTTYRWH